MDVLYLGALVGFFSLTWLLLNFAEQL